MRASLQRLFYTLTLLVLLWSIILGIYTGTDWTWQVIAFAWANIAMLNQWEIDKLKNNKDE